ncbi:SPFH domain-containing protein [Shewanella amazonensis]|uniref:SPFH domain, Band 7 family protein n=1 Tax=Shewanella amazonensis (strain ATCC BAA-1098 / SB2B) TaxID=326297 RepID=A1S2M0_SHEAM|nr:stomatin-like protein [Shewanella amazonensis]ABL98626.1 SPFH domain, Band 7 family protein [Shewanella amazonensis SB2B]
MQLAVNEDLIVMAIWGLIFFIFIIKLFQSIRLVPTKSAYIVERLGKYHSTLDAGFHALIPFVDKVAYVHDLKEETIDVPPQECFSSDEVKVEVDGVIYISVVDPVKASYGVTDYRYAAIQLAQTTTRSVIGTLELDRTFEERDVISAKVVEVLDQAGALWGIRVHRYEIKNIQPPETVKNAMEMQVNAERERRALLAKSEGDKQAKINRSEGIKAETINRSEGEMQKRINEAEGKAEEILAIARATAESIERLAEVISAPGGQNALRLQLGEQYLTQLKGLGQQGSRVVVPANMVNFDQWMDAMGLKEQR